MLKIFEFIKNLSLVEKQKLYEELNLILNKNSDLQTSENILEVKKIVKEENGILCPYCKSSKIYKHAKYKNRQRYKCTECKHTFNDLTGSPMSGSHYIKKWFKYFNCMKEGFSLRKTAEKLKISLPTAFQWRHKIMEFLQIYPEEKLQGIIETDETFFLYSEKGNKQIKHRKARKRGGKAKKRGISKEQIPVITTCDRKNHLILGVCKGGKLTFEEVEKILGNSIIEDKETTLCSDGEQSYKYFSIKHNINHEVITPKRGKRVNKKIYHIQHINNFHSRLKQWMDKFHGVATKYLSRYVHWFQKLEKLKKSPNLIFNLMKFALTTLRITTAKSLKTGDTQFSLT